MPFRNLQRVNSKNLKMKLKKLLEYGISIHRDVYYWLAYTEI